MNANEAQEVFHSVAVFSLNSLECLGNECPRFMQVVFNRSLERGRCHGSSECCSVIDVPGIIHFMGGLVDCAEEFLMRVSTVCFLKKGARAEWSRPEEDGASQAGKELEAVYRSHSPHSCLGKEPVSGFCVRTTV